MNLQPKIRKYSRPLATLILNYLSRLGLRLDKRRAFQAWVLTYLDIVYLELLTARVHGAKESAIEALAFTFNYPLWALGVICN